MIQMNNKLSFPRLKARDIIKSLDIRHPKEIEIEEIAYVRHMIVREHILDGAEGRLVRKGNWGIATINRNIPELGRKRFAISHELGHFELHESVDPVRLCNDKDFLWYGKTNPEEKEANEFAAELLMPEFLFQPMCKSIIPCFDYIACLAEQFRTSLTLDFVHLM
jgi:Zn-dependent peptidase ImmA (M78 family)